MIISPIAVSYGIKSLSLSGSYARGEATENSDVDILKEIPWKEMKGMRTWVAHQYLDMDAAVIWAVAKEDLPPLRAFCDNWLSEHT